ncbi:MAG: TadE/TadG family type IV pilus assembly protein [Hyphomicrobiaceae bacterium]
MSDAPIRPRSITRALSAAVAKSKRFARSQDGSIGVMFGGIIVIMVMFLGASVDFGKAFMVREGMQDALDSAALAAGRELETGGEKEDAEVKAREVFLANLPDGAAAELTNVDVDTDSGVVTLAAATTLQTSFLRIAGINELPLDAEAIVSTNGGSFEVALVLDGSGSMKGTHIEGLKSAAHSLVGSLFGDKSTSKNVKIGVIPFAALVNVGPQNANEQWIDSDGRSSSHFENMDEHVSRFELFSRMRNVSWAGCVEVRPGAFATTDSEPDVSEPDSLFVPAFAPDEPDTGNSNGNRYYNSYLADDGGSCAKQASTCVRRDWRGTCLQYRTATLDPAVAQTRLCKYDNASVTEGLSGATISGPNHMCDSRPITPLTNDRNTVDNAIDDLIAQGYTNIGEGVMWGWRVLSPQEPFTEGLPKNSPNNLKVLIVMSDGANTLNALSNHNQSYYSGWGYAVTGRLNANPRTSSGFTSAMNDQTQSACQNARSDGVTIYSVAYNMDTQPAARALLRSCASESDKYFEASSTGELIKVFEAIGLDLNSLRISS